MHADIERLLISQQQIAARVAELAEQITRGENKGVVKTKVHPAFPG